MDTKHRYCFLKCYECKSETFWILKMKSVIKINGSIVRIQLVHMKHHERDSQNIKRIHYILTHEMVTYQILWISCDWRASGGSVFEAGYHKTLIILRFEDLNKFIIQEI